MFDAWNVIEWRVPPSQAVVSLDFGEHGRAMFVRKCPKCGRWIRRDGVFGALDERGVWARGRCARCGTVELLFFAWEDGDMETPPV